MPKSEKTVEQCMEEEKRDIRRRRMVHQASQAEEPAADESNRALDRFTGLALSGGGVRSAAFSLGFLQAMYTAGRMKAFDYLSTVSGGGYAGGLFSSLVARETNEINWERNGTHNRLEFEPLRTGGQPDIVERLSLHGRMMGNFLRLFSRHLWGFLVNVTFVVSGLFAIAALLAYVMRSPWSLAMAPTLAELKFNSDLTVPFFFTFVIFVFWVLSQLLARIAAMVKKEIPPIGLIAYVLLLASVLLGILTMLAIKDIDLGTALAGRNEDDRFAAMVNQIVRWLGVGISTVFATFMLPYLTPRRLLQSGDPGAGPVQSLIFRAAGNGLIIGAPLFIFFFLVHENISGFNSSRDNADQLTPSHLAGSLEFAAFLESQVNSKVEPPVNSKVESQVNNKVAPVNSTVAPQVNSKVASQVSSNIESQINGTVEPRRELARRLYEALTDSRVADWQKVELPEELKQLQRDYDSIRIANEKFSFGSRCLQWLANFVRIDDQFGKRLEIAAKSRAKEIEIVQRFNRKILSDPELFLDLERNRKPLDADSPLERDSNRRLLTELGLPVGVPVPTNDDRLERALISLRTAKNQLAMRFASLELALPKSNEPLRVASREHFTFALAWLSGDRRALPSDKPETASNKPEPSKATLDNEIAGPFLSTMDQLMEDPALQSRIEEFLPQIKVSNDFDASDFETWKAKQALVVGDLSRTVRENNWLLLERIFPHYVRPPSTVFARVVNEADQTCRLQVAGYAFMIFLIVGLFSNLNTTSLHGVYRDQLAEIWLPVPDIRLHQLDTCSRGAPYHIINGTVNRMGHRNDPDIEGRSRFIFSHRFCGTKKIGFRETEDYENGSISVADAVAISGGAVTSVNAPTALQQLILFLTNFRLGQWVSSPITYSKDYYWPSPIRTIANLMWLPEQRKFLFISDGGHNDNTGLASLFERKCRLVVCVDASQDSGYEFRDFLKVLHASRAKYGVRIEPLDRTVALADALDSLRPGACDRSENHFVTFVVHYPDQAQPAALIYCKLTVTGDEALDLVERTRAAGSFPHDPTSDQFLLPNIFESYLELGRHVGEQVDLFVRDKGLDSFDIGQGWCGTDHPTKPSESKSESKVVAGVTSANAADVPIHALDNAKFDEEGVDQAIKVLDQYASTQLSHANVPDQSPDTSMLEIVSSWAREHGIDAPRALRRKFCTAIINQANQFTTEIKAIPLIRLHYCMMLEALGDSVPGSRQALKNLATADTVA